MCVALSVAMGHHDTFGHSNTFGHRDTFSHSDTFDIRDIFGHLNKVPTRTGTKSRMTKVVTMTMAVAVTFKTFGDFLRLRGLLGTFFETKISTVTSKVTVTLDVTVTLKVTLSKVLRSSRTTIFKLVGPCEILSRSKSGTGKKEKKYSRLKSTKKFEN